MPATFTDTQELLKNTARKFFRAECPMVEVRRIMETATACDEPLWRKMADQGWMGVMLPEQYEGIGMGLHDLAVLVEEMGRALVPGPYLATLTAQHALASSGNEDAKNRYLPPICRGESRAALALLEADANWDPCGVRLEVAAANGGFTLRGRKLFVPDAAVSNYLVCAVRIAGDLALVILDRTAEGLKIEAMPALDATRRLYAVDFQDVRIGAAGVLATGVCARAALEAALDIGAVGVVMEMVGGMQRVLEMTIEYAKTRKQFGRPIGQFQAVQHLCADMYLLAESSRTAAWAAVSALEANEADARTSVAVAKVYVGDACREVGNRAIQVHGGMGFTWENDLHLYYRRAKAAENLFGAGTYHRERIAADIVEWMRGL